MVALSPLVTSEEEPCVISSLLIGILFTWGQWQSSLLSEQVRTEVTLWGIRAVKMLVYV